MKIATSLEQSEKLLKLGLTAESADMWYVYHEIIERDFDKIYDDFPIAKERAYTKEGIPAWSLSALMNLMPEIILHITIFKMYLYKTEQGTWMISYDLGHRFKIKEIEKDDVIDAAYEMVVWLIEKEYIKTNKETKEN